MLTSSTVARREEEPGCPPVQCCQSIFYSAAGSSRCEWLNLLDFSALIRFDCADLIIGLPDPTKTALTCQRIWLNGQLHQQ